MDYLVRPRSKQKRRKGDNTLHGDTRSARCITGAILWDINVSCLSFLTSLTSSASFPRLTAFQDIRLSHVLGLLSHVVPLGTPYPKFHWRDPQPVHVTAIFSPQFYTQSSFLFLSPKTKKRYCKWRALSMLRGKMSFAFKSRLFLTAQPFGC